jgi:hypothetical protein
MAHAVPACAGTTQAHAAGPTGPAKAGELGCLHTAAAQAQAQERSQCNRRGRGPLPDQLLSLLQDKPAAPPWPNSHTSPLLLSSVRVLQHGRSGPQGSEPPCHPAPPCHSSATARRACSRPLVWAWPCCQRRGPALQRRQRPRLPAQRSQRRAHTSPIRHHTASHTRGALLASCARAYARAAAWQRPRSRSARSAAAHCPAAPTAPPQLIHRHGCPSLCGGRKAAPSSKARAPATHAAPRQRNRHPSAARARLGTPRRSPTPAARATRAHRPAASRACLSPTNACPPWCLPFQLTAPL